MGKNPRARWAEVRGPVGRRWLHWLLTAAAVTATGALLLPVLRQHPAEFHTHFARAAQWQRMLAIFAASVSAAWIAFNLLSPRLVHLRRAVMLRHPPVWCAWVVAVAILCVLDLTVGLGPTGFRAKPWEWVMYAGGSCLLVALYRRLAATPMHPVAGQSSSVVMSVEELVRDWKKLEKWLRCERPAEDDLIGSRCVARRLAEYLAAHGGSVGLVGPFGSGKSSVIAWLREDVLGCCKQGQTEIWFAEQSCWGFEDSGSAVQQILAQAVDSVAMRADCFSIRSLPEGYRKTFSAGGDWLRTLADLTLGSADPVDRFREVSEILETMNARLVLVIEDLDRTTSGRFDRQEVLALLQRLRASSSRISFVLATGQSSARDIDFAKLCDHIEILPTFEAPEVSLLEVDPIV